MTEIADVQNPLAGVLSADQIDAMVTAAEELGQGRHGVEELLTQMTKAVLERAMEAELSDHLGYEAGDPAGHGTGNSRNGKTTKRVQTLQGPVELTVPRDRNSSFEPVIVPKRARRLGKVEDMILSLYARGMTTRDIGSHLEEIYGSTVSAATISRVTDVVTDEIALWQSRPLETVYPIVYIDAIWLKIRDGGVVANKACHVAVGVDLEGRKQVLGLWLGATEGAKFWAGVLAEIRNRGCKDILILCCDGLTGLPAAVNSVYPETVVQTCVVHLLRSAMKYASYADRKTMAKDMKPIYTAATVQAAELAMEAFAETWGTKAPGAVMAWRNAWEDFTPFLAFTPEIRKVIYTTNQIESINYQLRKITKTRGSFPSVEAAIKLVYLGIRNIETTRGGDLGTGTQGWHQALNAFAVQFPNRLPL
ncbi:MULTISPECIES: IS256 family transposase [Mycobacteriales]|jgi:putative transposase|uniref:Mutator family transposase n=1 Tax=Dietzia cercidiphylli TaxID=498199 RepID=A0ABP4UCB3_9ACTN|nr:MULTISPECIES: IS256 family transposase [Dietzia]MBB1049275.1 IS256 family transposase [Dietzia cercidiphylli]MBB1052421.1 IS256 family transposase [Dietzia sp. CW19]MCT2061639.1 IS256 family transposase [Dietzia cinnamea]MCT2237805.1 IS256 family transposase [Dietzia cinnamea]